MRGGATYTELKQMSVCEFARYVEILSEILNERAAVQSSGGAVRGGQTLDVSGVES